MESWLQSLAVGVAVLVGWISPAGNLQVQASALRGTQTVDLHAEVAGAVTAEVQDYLLAGNTLMMEFEVVWGGSRFVRERVIVYHAWEGAFTVTGDGMAEAVQTKDAKLAFQTWATLSRVSLGTFSDLKPLLGASLAVTVMLKPVGSSATPGSVASLWHYKSPSTSLLYRSWLELPQ